jgi:hypothetical protein
MVGMQGDDTIPCCHSWHDNNNKFDEGVPLMVALGEKTVIGGVWGTDGELTSSSIGG